MPSTHNQIGLGLLCGAGAGALWGLVFLAPEMARDFGPLELTIGRYLAYGLIAALLIGPRWRALFAKLGRREWMALGWLALSGNTLYYIMVSQAVQLGGIAMTSLIMGLVPVAVTVVGSREKNAVSLSRLMPSILLCLASAVAVGWDAIASLLSSSGTAPLIGLIFAIGGLISWTIFAIVNSRWLGRLGDMSAHDWSLLIGIVSGAQSLLLLPFLFAFVPMEHSAHGWSYFIAISLGIALFSSIAGNALWNRANRLMPLTMVGQMVLFETLFALLYAFMWEQRGPSYHEMIAFACVVASVISCMAAHRKPAASLHAL
ncbi:MAG TPA: DMT family transporter [Sphingopyxis sp.]|nr:DMT family transporter [Sphingopyxis sp.]